jgi:DNA-binding transcriptional ArsR family regulator
MTEVPDDTSIPVLPANVPVVLPELPPHMDLTTAQQFRAVQEPTRVRILGMLLYQSLTAKQIAARLGIPHGTVGYHLQVLEEAGLVQVIAKRAVRSMIAKYYARTATVFTFKMPPEVTGATSLKLQIITQTRDEMADILATGKEVEVATPFAALLHLQVSPEQADLFEERLRQLITEFAATPRDAEGLVYGISAALYLAPPYLQRDAQRNDSALEDGD